MQVNLSFDTENEKVDNLKKLVEALEQLIAHREGRSYQPGQKTQTSTVAPVEQKPAQDKTAGGCRVIPYEDMSGKMSSLFSGRRI
jgi:hypothetical protein